MQKNYCTFTSKVQSLHEANSTAMLSMESELKFAHCQDLPEGAGTVLASVRKCTASQFRTPYHVQLRYNPGTVRAKTLTESYLILTNTVPMLNLTRLYDPLQNKRPTYFKVTN
jgi:hypothetical protein